MWSGDTWDKDDICTDDPCDPWHHCWGGSSTFGGSFCASRTETNATLSGARSEALTSVLSACTSRAGNGRCGYKSPFDTSDTGSGSSCSNCCHDITRESGPTNYLCIGETNNQPICVPGSSCP
jgi:hypothetical protein